MPSPLSIHFCELKGTVSSLFVQFELQQKKTIKREHDNINDANETNEESNEQEMHADSIKYFLMNKQNCYVKKSDAKNGDNKDLTYSWTWNLVFKQHLLSILQDIYSCFLIFY